ncbi:hypothetical protein [Limnohabitans sp.]|uniref:hypothetical protein n=1 Tax=Limnohabitans sp. TaxID=1907725 RepID=UPI00311D2BE5
MTPNDFATALYALGWKQADFCRKAGTHPNTTTNWLKGKTPIPPWVPAYLGALQDIQRLHLAYVATTPATDKQGNQAGHTE